jgi:hypothetical protein
MKTNIQKVPIHAAADSLFDGTPLLDGKGNTVKSGAWHIINRFDDFLSSAAEALAADGIERKAIMTLFVNHAVEVLNKAPGVTQPMKKANAETVLQSILQFHSIYDDPQDAV